MSSDQRPPEWLGSILPRSMASLLAEQDEAIKTEAAAAAAAVMARRRVDVLIAARAGLPPEAAAAASPLVTLRELANHLGVSVAHARRLDPPGLVVGAEQTKRYDLEAVRAWLAEREPAPTTPKSRTTVDNLNVSGAMKAAGLRVVGGRGT